MSISARSSAPRSSSHARRPSRVLSSLVCVAVTSTVRGHPAEVELARSHGVREPSAANCDWLITVSKDRFLRRRGELDPPTARRLDAALVIALGLDGPPIRPPAST
jgi:mRNA-degrading endonuclease toxin of MazEF toxin-antitoxin module